MSDQDREALLDTMIDDIDEALEVIWEASNLLETISTARTTLQSIKDKLEQLQKETGKE